MLLYTFCYLLNSSNDGNRYSTRETLRNTEATCARDSTRLIAGITGLLFALVYAGLEILTENPEATKRLLNDSLQMFVPQGRALSTEPSRTSLLR